MKTLNKITFFVLLLFYTYSKLTLIACANDVTLNPNYSPEIYNVEYSMESYFKNMESIINKISHEDKSGQLRVLNDVEENEISYFVINLIYDSTKKIQLIISKKDLSTQGFINSQNIYYYFSNSYIKKIQIADKSIKLHVSNGIFDLKMLEQTVQFSNVAESISNLMNYQDSSGFINSLIKFFKGEASNTKKSISILLFVTEYSLKFQNVFSSSVGILTHKNRKEKIADFEFYLKNWNFYNIKYFKKEKEPVYILNIYKQPTQMQIKSYSLLPFYKSKYKNDTLKKLLIGEHFILNGDYKINNIELDFNTVLIFDKIFFENKYYKDIDDIRNKYNSNIVIKNKYKNNIIKQDNEPLKEEEKSKEKTGVAEDIIEEESKPFDSKPEESENLESQPLESQSEEQETNEEVGKEVGKEVDEEASKAKTEVEEDVKSDVETDVKAKNNLNNNSKTDDFNSTAENDTKVEDTNRNDDMIEEESSKTEETENLEDKPVENQPAEKDDTNKQQEEPSEKVDEESSKTQKDVEDNVEAENNLNNDSKTDDLNSMDNKQPEVDSENNKEDENSF